jgi:hypothetical protein
MLSNQVLGNLQSGGNFGGIFSSDDPLKDLLAPIRERCQSFVKVRSLLPALKSSFRLAPRGICQGVLNLIERDEAPFVGSPPGFPNLISGDAFYISGERHSGLGLVTSSLHFLKGCSNRFLENVIIGFGSVVLRTDKPPQ